MGVISLRNCTVAYIFLHATACNSKRVFATVEASFHLSVPVLLGLSPFISGLGKLLVVHLQLRRGFCRPSPYWTGLWPFDPVLTEASADRPRHRPRFSFVPGFDPGSRRLSPASAGFLPSAFDGSTPTGASILFVIGLGRPLAALLRLRAGLTPSVPDLGRLLAGLLRFRPPL